MFLTKFNDNYGICCHGNNCASAPPTSFKARYLILKAYKKMEYVDFYYLLSLSINIHNYRTLNLLMVEFLTEPW